jgi:spectrin alpha
MTKQSAAQRRQRLGEAKTFFQFFRDLDDDETWIKEIKLLVRSEDFGSDLKGVQNLRKNHKPLVAELCHTSQPFLKCNSLQISY